MSANPDEQLSAHECWETHESSVSVWWQMIGFRIVFLPIGSSSFTFHKDGLLCDWLIWVRLQTEAGKLPPMKIWSLVCRFSHLFLEITESIESGSTGNTGAIISTHLNVLSEAFEGVNVEALFAGLQAGDNLLGFNPARSDSQTRQAAVEILGEPRGRDLATWREERGEAERGETWGREIPEDEGREEKRKREEVTSGSKHNRSHGVSQFLELTSTCHTPTLLSAQILH